jgi:glutamine amidotransferase
LFFSSAVKGLRRLYPDNPVIQRVSDDTRLVVSEPLGDLPGAWNAVPESSYGVVHEGHDSLHEFHPKAP